MKNDRLPPIFTKLLKKVQNKKDPPHIIINVDYNQVKREHERDPIYGFVEFYSTFWIEVFNEGFLCNFDSETFTLLIGHFNKDAEAVELFSHKVDQDSLNSREFLPKHQRSSLDLVLVIMGILTKHRAGKKTSVFTASRNKGSVFYAEGDVTKFKRIFDFKKLPAPEYKRPEPGSSGIRKKEHDVIGHWRHYPSGAKVWVKPHKRGDPSLGRVTSVFS